ncbi:MAG: hypothetical protein ABIL20_07165, partial [candidate division WOR-3 bacterium]
YLYDNFAYVSEVYTGLYIIDVSNPFDPNEVKQFFPPGTAHGIFVSYPYTYVAYGQAGLRVINEGYCITPDEAEAVIFSNGFAYVACGIAGLRIIEALGPDNAEPDYPIEVGYWDTPDSALDVCVVGNYAYIADYNGGLRIIDVSEPSAPEEIAFYNLQTPILDVYYFDSCIYAAAHTSGLRIINVSTPAFPQEIGYYDTPGECNGVFISNNLAYLADGHFGLRIIDISNPSSPYEIGFYDTPGYARRVFVIDSFAFVADCDSGIRVINVLNPASPHEDYSSGPFPAVDVFAIHSYYGPHVYAADMSGGLRIYGFALGSITESTKATFKDKLKLMQNPVSGNYIPLMADDKRQIPFLALYDCSGRKVRKYDLHKAFCDGGKIYLSTVGLANGIYFLRSDVKGKPWSQKVVLIK